MATMLVAVKVVATMVVVMMARGDATERGRRDGDADDSMNSVAHP